MSKIAVIYWSQTGNTELMAEAIAQGVRDAGSTCELFALPSIGAQEALAYDKLALGCPAMGAEVLEEMDFEPFFTELEGSLSGRKVALFGSYGWGDGQWMRDWAARTQEAGADLYRGEGLMVHETSDAAALDLCKAFGAGFAND